MSEEGGTGSEVDLSQILSDMAEVADMQGRSRLRRLRRSQGPGCDIIDLLFGGAFAHRWTLRAVDPGRWGSWPTPCGPVQSGDGVHGRRPACTQRGAHTRTRTRTTARRGLLKGRGNWAAAVEMRKPPEAGELGGRGRDAQAAGGHPELHP